MLCSNHIMLFRIASIFAVSAAAALFISGGVHAAERPLAARSSGPAFGLQDPLAVAFDGDYGLVTWTDWRSGDKSAVYASRVVDGVVSPDAIRDFLPFVVRAGASWLGFNANSARAWSDSGELRPVVPLPFGPQRNGEVASNGKTVVVIRPYGIWDAVGIMNSDLTGFRNLSSPHPLIDPDKVVTDGTDYFIFGYAYRPHNAPHYQVSVVRLSSSGDVLATVETKIVGDVIEVVWTGRDFVLATANHGIFRLAADLTSSSAAISIASGRAYAPMLAAGQSGEAIATWTERAGGDLQVYASHIHQDSAGPPRLLGSLSRPYRYDETIRASATSRDYIIIGPDLRTMRLPIDPDARASEQVWTDEPLVSPTSQHSFTAVRDGSADAWAFVEEDGATSRIIVGRAGMTPRPLIASRYSQLAPSIASTGTRFLITWFEKRSGHFDGTLLAMPLDSELRPLLSEPLMLDAVTAHRSPEIWGGQDQFRWPAGIVWTGSMYLVAWYGRVARILEDGTMIDPEPREIYPENADHVTLARMGDVILAVWMAGGPLRTNCPYVCGTTHIFSARLTGAGEPIDSNRIELPEGWNLGLPDIAVNGDVALVVADPGVMFTLDAHGRAGAPVRLSSSYLAHYRPTVARHRDGFLFAWQHGISEERWAQLVSRELTRSTPFLLATDSGRTQGPGAWTTTTGDAAVAYLRVNAHTVWVPRLYMNTFEEATRSRRRAAGR